MRPLTASDILKVWEQGEGQSALDRALAILAVACAEASRDELAALSVGHRDARLFELRELTFGPRLDGFAACPRCEERLEFALETAEIRARAAAADEEFEFETGGLALRFRLPNSRDLTAVVACEDLIAARRMLAAACVLQTGRNGEAVAELPNAAVERLAERIGECSERTEVILDFACPSCGCEWRSPLDIAAFFWAEIAAEARRLLREVHLLARAYGWREAEILVMGARRRRAYLEMIG